MSIYGKIAEAEKSNTAIAVCTVISTKGSTPAKTGAKMLVKEDGSIYGTVGGGELERKVIQDALAVIGQNEPRLFRHDLLHQHSMCCGGVVELYIEPVIRQSRLYIFGAGHVGSVLAKYSADAGFEVVVIDDRKDYTDAIAIEGVNKMNLDFDLALKLLPFDRQTYIAIMTYDHAIDRNILSFCIKKPHAYLGMIGSERKVLVTGKQFMDAGIATEEELNAVDMPMGLIPDSDGPVEIAISILAKLITVKHSLRRSNKIQTAHTTAKADKQAPVK